MRIRVLKLFGLGAALVLFVLAAGNKGQVGLAQAGCTVTVQPGQSIQQAVNNAAEVAVICLEAGTYVENVSINKDLTLRAIDSDPTKTVLDGSGGQAADQATILISAGSVTISGFTIKGGRRGIDAQNATAVTVLSNIITDNIRQGVLFERVGTGEIRENQILKNKAQAGIGRGIQIVNSGSKDARVKILNNTISENEVSGLFINGSWVEVRGNTISNNKLRAIPETGGVLITAWEGASSDALLENNEITSNQGEGVAIFFSSTLEANKNTITDNGRCGVNAFQDGEATIKGQNNTIKNNARGDLCGNPIGGWPPGFKAP